MLILSLGDTGQYLKTVSSVTTGGVALGTQQVETREATALLNRGLFTPKC